LLAARQRGAGLLELVLDLVPDRGAAKALLDQLVHVALVARHTRAERDVVVDRLGERVWLLEHHPDPAPDLDRVDLWVVQVHAVIQHLAREPRGGDEVVHPVEAAQQRALAATRGADERGDPVPRNREVDVPYGAEQPVVRGEALHLEHRRFGRGRAHERLLGRWQPERGTPVTHDRLRLRLDGHRVTTFVHICF
jgi:hypothetical protein